MPYPVRSYAMFYLMCFPVMTFPWWVSLVFFNLAPARVTPRAVRCWNENVARGKFHQNFTPNFRGGKSTQNKKVHLKSWVPDSRHRELGKSSRELFEKVRANAVFFGISGFWVGFWASKMSRHLWQRKAEKHLTPHFCRVAALIQLFVLISFSNGSLFNPHRPQVLLAPSACHSKVWKHTSATCDCAAWLPDSWQELLGALHARCRRTQERRP